MTEIRPASLERVGLAQAVELMEPFAGRRVGVDEPISSSVEGIDDVDGILNYFYNGGAFQGLRTALLSSNYSREEDEHGVSHSMQRTFAEPVRKGHTGTRMSTPLSGPTMWFEERQAIIQYYPASHQVMGRSMYVDSRRQSHEYVYRVSATPSGLLYAEQDSEPHPPMTIPEVTIAKHALQRLVFDVANDVALGLSGA